eukprot:SM000145S00798  [mRNA]  locus=s145:180931:182240:+ [translate_table: standard]
MKNGAAGRAGIALLERNGEDRSFMKISSSGNIGVDHGFRDGIKRMAEPSRSLLPHKRIDNGLEILNKHLKEGLGQLI